MVINKPSAQSIQLQKILENLKSVKVKVGWLGGNKYPTKQATPVAQVAMVHEFGAPKKNIPPRPFIRPTITEHQNEWKDDFKKGAKAILEGRMTPRAVMVSMGELIAGQIREKISTIQEPGLAESTKKAKLRKRADRKTSGSLDKPLIDSGLLISTIVSVVEE